MNTSIDALSNKRRPLYEVWPGENKFWGKGKYFVGSEYKKGIMLQLALILKLVLVLSFVLLVEAESSLEVILYSTLEVILFGLTSFFLFNCTFTDPGALPVNVFNFSHRGGNMIFLDEENGNAKYYVKQGRLFKIKMCKTCLIIRPPGTGHCRVCNICIERYDHHCPWVGNCVGRNNYRVFFSFTFFFNLFVFYNLGLSFSQFLALHSCINFSENEFKYTMNNNYTQYNCTYYLNSLDLEVQAVTVSRTYICLLLFIISFLTLGFVSTLFLFHLKFVYKNLTTASKAKLKEMIKITGNPFDQGGLVKNVKKVLCTKDHKRRINYREYVTIVLNEMSSNGISSESKFKSDDKFCNTEEEKDVYNSIYKLDKLENTKEFSNFMFDYDYDRVKFEMKNFNVKLNEEASDHSPNMIPNTGKSKLPPISQSKLRNIKLSINLEMTTTERKKPPTPTHDHPEVSLPPECKNK